jgi:hypothetical protein
MAKSKGINMGEYLATPEEWEAYRWCIRNAIYIAPKALTEARWTITITNKGITNQDPESYTKVVIWETVFKYYKYYYDKYKI